MMRVVDWEKTLQPGLDRLGFLLSLLRFLSLMLALWVGAMAMFLIP